MALNLYDSFEASEGLELVGAFQVCSYMEGCVQRVADSEGRVVPNHILVAVVGRLWRYTLVRGEGGPVLIVNRAGPSRDVV